MKTKYTIIAVIVVIIFGLAIGVGVKRARSGSDSDSEKSTSISASQDTKSDAKKDSSAEATTELAEAAATKSADQVDAKSDEGSKDSSDDASDSKSSDKNVSSQKNSVDADKEMETEEDKAIDLPYEIEDTGIKITRIKAYDGLFLEDGSDIEKENMTAIKVKNSSGKNVEYGSIILEADGTELEFDFSDLPKDASIVVMEKDATTFDSKWEFKYVDSQFAYIDSFSKLEDDVSLTVNDNDSITIKNISGSTIPELRLFYKYKVDSGEYIGGITYTAKIGELKSGAKTTVSPSHFTKKGSKIMMVRTYDEATE